MLKLSEQKQRNTIQYVVSVLSNTVINSSNKEYQKVLQNYSWELIKNFSEKKELQKLTIQKLQEYKNIFKKIQEDLINNEELQFSILSLYKKNPSIDTFISLLKDFLEAK